jgi:hypothetical protein
MSETPAGWYDDGSGRQRWWDGRAWAAEPTPERGARVKWPWILGGALLAAVLLGVVLLGVGSTVLVLNTAGSPASEALEAPGLLEPREVVLAYYQAHEEKDCDLFVSVTTEQFREEIEIPDCEAFLRNLEVSGMPGDGENSITAVREEDGAVTVYTEETVDLGGELLTFSVEYYLYAENGVWRIDQVE